MVFRLFLKAQIQLALNKTCRYDSSCSTAVCHKVALFVQKQEAENVI